MLSAKPPGRVLSWFSIETLQHPRTLEGGRLGGHFVCSAMKRAVGKEYSFSAQPGSVLVDEVDFFPLDVLVE